MPSESEARARVGDVIAGKYQLKDLIAVGGMGAVYSATHALTGRACALKLLSRDSEASFESVERFLREARATAAIGHPGIVEILDAGTSPAGDVFLSLELLSGKTLQAVLEQGPLEPERAVAVCVQILDALQALHEHGIVHRDIKPSNIFVLEGSELRIKLLDFGVAKESKSSSDLTVEGSILGTPGYMSPEQARGDSVDARADIWSVGAILFRAVSGRLPFEAATQGELIAAVIRDDPPKLASLSPELPGWFSSVVDRALERDPSRRFADAMAMKTALETRAETASTAPRFERGAWLAALVAIVLGISALLVWRTARGRANESAAARPVATEENPSSAASSVSSPSESAPVVSAASAPSARPARRASPKAAPVVSSAPAFRPVPIRDYR